MTGFVTRELRVGDEVSGQSGPGFFFRGVVVGLEGPSKPGWYVVRIKEASGNIPPDEFGRRDVVGTKMSFHQNSLSLLESRKMNIDALVEQVAQGADPKKVVESAVPEFKPGHHVLVQGLPAPLTGKVIGTKEGGDIVSIETEKGTMDIPARHLVMQEGTLKHEQAFTSLPMQNFLLQNGFTFQGAKGHFDEWVALQSLAGNPSERRMIEVGPIWGEGGEMETEIEGWQIFIGGRPARGPAGEGGIGAASLRDAFERLGWL